MARTTATKASSAKPYDRPASYQLKERGKGKPSSSVDTSNLKKAASGKSKSNGAVDDDGWTLPASLSGSNVVNSTTSGDNGKAINIGAPSQAGQSSRKGKKAWRKNVDIAEIEIGLEAARAEERVTGGNLAERRNEALFTVDVTGDAAMAANLARNRPKKPLRSLAILSERSAVPALTSRTITAPTSSSKSTSRSGPSPQEKARLRRMALKEHRPDNASAPQAQISNSTQTTTDAWAPAPAPATLPGGFGDDVIAKPQPRAPITLAKRRDIRAKAIASGKISAGEVPDAGTSYNPTVDSHAALLDSAVQEELAKLEKERKVDEEVAALGDVIANRRNGMGMEYEFAGGMNVGPGEGNVTDDEEDDDDEELGFKPKETKRKTRAERNKALRRKIAEQERRSAAAQAKLNKSAGALASFKRAEEAKAAAQAETLRLKRLAKAEKERSALLDGGEKVGKFKVPKQDVVVQLGDDLAETLRQIKPEGNAFKDRFLALQKKGLVEPRLPTSKRTKNGKKKEFEKHAYKRFE